MTLRHNNFSQEAEVESFDPLLQDESPYYKNINRAPKNAYDYANNINNTLSYNGAVSRVPSLGNQTFNLYDIVALLDNEVIDNIRTTSQIVTRYGIVVTLADDQGYYIVVTFCPNFVYPAAISGLISNGIGNPSGFTSPTTLGGGSILYLDNNLSNPTPQNNYWLTTSTTGLSSTIPLGKITGASSMFFCGTANLF